MSCKLIKKIRLAPLTELQHGICTPSFTALLLYDVFMHCCFMHLLSVFGFWFFCCCLVYALCSNVFFIYCLLCCKRKISTTFVCSHKQLVLLLLSLLLNEAMTNLSLVNEIQNFYVNIHRTLVIAFLKMEVVIVLS